MVQAHGRRYGASDVDFDGNSVLQMDIAGAYSERAHCRQWNRVYSLQDGCMSITDTYAIDCRMAPDVENFLTCGKTYLPGEFCPANGSSVKKGEVVVVSEDKIVVMSYPSILTPSVVESKIDDEKMAWERLQRISFTSSSTAPLKGKYKFTIRQLR